jgi:hypothetical protein
MVLNACVGYADASRSLTVVVTLDDPRCSCLQASDAREEPLNPKVDLEAIVSASPLVLSAVSARPTVSVRFRTLAASLANTWPCPCVLCRRGALWPPGVSPPLLGPTNRRCGSSGTPVTHQGKQQARPL